MGSNNNQIIVLNVGGCEYTTTRSTLTKYPESMLAAMFSENMPSTLDDEGRYFIDRDGKMFEHILRFFRSKELVLPDKFTDYDALYAEADFFQIQPLIDAVKSAKNPKRSNTWESFLIGRICDKKDYFCKVFYKLVGEDHFRETPLLQSDVNDRSISDFTNVICYKDPGWECTKYLCSAGAYLYLSYIGIDLCKCDGFVSKQMQSLEIWEKEHL